MPVMSREVSANVALAIAAILRDDDRRRERIRSQRGARIPHTAGKTQEQAWRNRVLEIHLSGGFAVGDVLPLKRLLLHKLIWNQETHLIANQRDAQPVAVGKVSLVGSGETARTCTIREILQHRRVQIAVRVKSIAAKGKAILARRVRERCGAGNR